MLFKSALKESMGRKLGNTIDPVEIKARRYVSIIYTLQHVLIDASTWMVTILPLTGEPMYPSCRSITE